jgi:hypothetical protein
LKRNHLATLDERHKGSLTQEKNHLEDDDFPDPDVLLLVVGQEEEVAAVERRLHGPAEYDDDGRFGSGDYHQSLPNHEGGRDYHAKA